VVITVADGSENGLRLRAREIKFQGWSLYVEVLLLTRVPVTRDCCVLLPVSLALLIYHRPPSHKCRAHLIFTSPVWSDYYIITLNRARSATSRRIHTAADAKHAFQLTIILAMPRGYPHSHAPESNRVEYSRARWFLGYAIVQEVHRLPYTWLMLIYLNSALGIFGLLLLIISGEHSTMSQHNITLMIRNHGQNSAPPR
jgi:hypothetical protein